MVVFPNAKINIGLNITSRRPDGYHEITSIMIPIPWCDVLEIVPASSYSTTLTISGRNIDCPAEKNLVMKAYKALDSIYKIPAVDIYLRKIIPDGAGLGGGSADAAFTLTALNDMFKLNCSKEQLAEIASTIGADCPFFIYNTPMLATGIGTTLSPAPQFSIAGHTIVVVKPPFSIPTAEAYSKVTPRQPAIPLTDLIKAPIYTWRDNITNDFEPSVCHTHPAIDTIKSALYNLGADYCAMSGSGSAVYGIFNGDILAESLHRHFNGCDIFCGKLQ